MLKRIQLRASSVWLIFSAFNDTFQRLINFSTLQRLQKTYQESDHASELEQKNSLINDLEARLKLLTLETCRKSSELERIQVELTGSIFHVKVVEVYGPGIPDGECITHAIFIKGLSTKRIQRERCSKIGFACLWHARSSEQG